jgi:hypothetical protein
VHCGVRRDGAAVLGHAWLTLDGVPLLPEVHTNAWTDTYVYPPIAQVTAC